jgi:hypothetical protein
VVTDLRFPIRVTCEVADAAPLYCAPPESNSLQPPQIRGSRPDRTLAPRLAFQTKAQGATASWERKLFHVEQFRWISGEREPRSENPDLGHPSLFEAWNKLFHVEQFSSNGAGLARPVGSGLSCWACICVVLPGFVSCNSERRFSAICCRKEPLNRSYDSLFRILEAHISKSRYGAPASRSFRPGQTTCEVTFAALLQSDLCTG